VAEAGGPTTWIVRGVQAGVAERFRVIHVEIGVVAALDEHGVHADVGCPIHVRIVFGDAYLTGNCVAFGRVGVVDEVYARSHRLDLDFARPVSHVGALRIPVYQDRRDIGGR